MSNKALYHLTSPTLPLPIVMTSHHTALFFLKYQVSTKLEYFALVLPSAWNALPQISPFHVDLLCHFLGYSYQNLTPHSLFLYIIFLMLYSICICFYLSFLPSLEEKICLYYPLLPPWPRKVPGFVAGTKIFEWMNESHFSSWLVYADLGFWSFCLQVYILCFIS